MSTPSSDPTFKVERHGQDVTVPLGEHRLLDESAVRGIRESLMSLAANQVGGVLTLNLKRVEYLGSAMLETLINMYRKLKASGSALGGHLIKFALLVLRQAGIFGVVGIRLQEGRRPRAE